MKSLGFAGADAGVGAEEFTDNCLYACGLPFKAYILRQTAHLLPALATGSGSSTCQARMKRLRTVRTEFRHRHGGVEFMMVPNRYVFQRTDLLEVAIRHL
jgi:hypothetical protein